MRRALIIVLLSLASAAHAATNIEVTGTVVTSGVKRFGVSGISHYYYDRVLLKNLVWHNAGFEGLMFQSIMRCDSNLTSTGCLDTNPWTAWPSGFWNGATYDFILGTAKGRTGTIASTTAPPPPPNNTIGTTWTFADSGITPHQGDYFVARMYRPGGADVGWNPSAYNGATVTTELADLPPNTDGRQCLRMSAALGQSAMINSGFGSFAGQSFVALHGPYRLTFKAKGLGGTNSVTVGVMRGTQNFLTRSVPLTSGWATYTIDFTADETGNPTAFAGLQFLVSNSTVLLDDVDLRENAGDPANTTAFRDTVLSALRDFNPGIIRSHQMDLGDSLDDLLAPPFGRVRSEYHASTTDKATNQYGYHEFLELVEALNTESNPVEPWLVVPITFSETEMTNLLEYLGGPVTTPYGAKRAARGHATPWTDVFPRIHLEFGNESWNPVFLGGTMFAGDYGHRGNDIFAVARQSPYFGPKYNLVLGVQAANPYNTRITHLASTNHDALCVGPYMATVVDDYTDINEQLFAGLFAEASWWSMGSNGPIKTTYDMINATERPVPLMTYEVNLHTTQGSIPQDRLDLFTPSVGAGIAVADHMLNMLRQQKMRDQLVFSLGGYRFTRPDNKTVLIWGITRDMGVTDRKRPQYLALKIVNEALQGDLVQTAQSGDNPSWNQPLTNRIQLNNVPFIQSFAFAGGGRKAIVIFNLHRASPLDVTLSGVNAPSGNVTMKRLTSAAITDSNESSENVAITTQQLTGYDPAQPLTLPPFSMTVLVQDEP